MIRYFGPNDRIVPHCPILGINTLDKREESEDKWRGPGAYSPERHTPKRPAGTSSFRSVDRKPLAKNQSLPIGAYHQESTLIKKTFNVKTYIPKRKF